MHLKNRDDSNTKSGNRGVQGWCHSAWLGLSLSFGREVAPNGTILPLQSTEQQAVFLFLADLVGRGFESLQIFVQNNRLQNLPSFMWFRECRTHWLMAKTEAFLAEIFTGVAWQSTDSCGTIDMLRVHIYTIHI